MAQYIALAASALTLINPALKKKDLQGGSVSRSTYVERGNSLCFSTGLATGLALGIVIITQFQKRRIRERIRYSFFKWLNGDSKVDNNGKDAGSTTSSFIDPSTLGEESIIEVIANCNNTWTPNLFCSKITMKKGTRISLQKSKGVEVYYVLKGTADFLINEIEEESNTISVKESIVLNPWTMRSIANNTKDDLIMLRVSDAGDEESQNNGNLIVEKIDRQGAIETIKSGIKSSMHKLGDLRQTGLITAKDDTV